MNTEKTFTNAADKASMDEKTARKYRKLGKLPSDVKVDHDWRTRSDPFVDVWPEMEKELETNSGLRAKTLFFELQRRYEGQFDDSLLRTFQRRVKAWRATAGPDKEVFFAQKHQPGKLGQSDYTNMNKLGITIAGASFDHLVYHFTLTYSNWEDGTICFSESFESLSEGLQNALWKLGGVPVEHQTDRLSAAVKNLKQQEEFTDNYNGLLKHYGLVGRKTQAGSPNENGDIEQRNYRFKDAVDQALMLRGSRNFATRADYNCFLQSIFDQLNAGRRKRLAEEMELLRRLPDRRLDASTTLKGVSVGQGSTIRVKNNVYSIWSRLIGEKVDIRVFAEHLEVWYGQKQVDVLPRLRGRGKCLINYRHVIDSLVRKPGAFENYRYREELYPTSRFRIAYDDLLNSNPRQEATRQYLKILDLAAKESEQRTDEALRVLLDNGRDVTFAAVEQMVKSAQAPQGVCDVEIAPVSLAAYDELFAAGGAER